MGGCMSTLETLNTFEGLPVVDWDLALLYDTNYFEMQF